MIRASAPAAAAHDLARACLADGLPGGAADGFWFVLGTETGRERSVADSLAGAGFSFWLPERRIVMPAKRKLPRRVIHKPYFRGYLFVRMRRSLRGYVGMLRIRDVKAILGTSAGPTPVDDEIVNGLKDLIDKWERTGRRPKIAAYELSAGDSVLIKRGPFADFKARVEDGYSGTKRVRVIQNLFGGEAIATYDIDDLRKIS